MSDVSSAQTQLFDQTGEEDASASWNVSGGIMNVKHKITMLVLFVVGLLAFNMLVSNPAATDHHDETTWTAQEKYQIIDLLKNIERNTRD